jgi:excisionase family DNA binding protein
MGDEGDLLDIKQAAAFLNVSETSLRRWTNSGLLASLRIGRRRERRFRRADLLAFLEHHPRHDASARLDGAAGVYSAHEAPARLGMHLCGFYATDVERTRLASAFLLRALSNGAAGLFFGEDPVFQQIRAHMERATSAEQRRDVRDDSRFVSTPYRASAAAQLESIEENLMAAGKAGVSAVYIVGDLWSFATRNSKRSVVDYERAFGFRITARWRADTLCLYDVRRFGGRDILAALHNHPETLSQPAPTLLG